MGEGAATRQNTDTVPCSCGSMTKGHRLQFVMMAPFSMEILSAGRPSFCHWAFWESFVSKSSGSMPLVIGISLLTKSAIQKSLVSRFLNCEPKALLFKAAPNKTSPTDLFYTRNLSTTIVHQLFRRQAIRQPFGKIQSILTRIGDRFHFGFLRRRFEELHL